MKLRHNIDNSTLLSFDPLVQNNLLNMACYVPPALTWKPKNSMAHCKTDAPATYSASPRVTILRLNVKGYKLEELKAKIENGFIIIKGSHGEKRDEYGMISKMFSRKVAIPRDVVEDEIKIHLYSNGILSVSAMRRMETLDIEIPIQESNLPVSGLSKSFRLQTTKTSEVNNI
ncbi:alpha-crystallin A chain isoform X2 [Halyomorpha halys]|uniref:alpha-crystallin A chain isoform X2 n=1 Tax=Halyomorpha halys TaxID=286706 RepID=UPI0034D38298